MFARRGRSVLTQINPPRERSHRRRAFQRPELESRFLLFLRWPGNRRQIDLYLRRYLSLLEAVFILQPLPAWSANLGKRLVSSAKIHLVDSGVTAHLRGETDAEALARSATLGPLLETFVVQELRRQMGWSRMRAKRKKGTLPFLRKRVASPFFSFFLRQSQAQRPASIRANRSRERAGRLRVPSPGCRHTRPRGGGRAGRPRRATFSGWRSNRRSGSGRT